MGKRRMIAFLLSGSMLWGMLPAAAFAGEESTVPAAEETVESKADYDLGDDTAGIAPPDVALDGADKEEPESAAPEKEPALADAGAGIQPAALEDPVARAGDMEFETLQAAINAAGDQTVVELLADVTESVTVAEGQDITLDLNGKTLTGKKNAKDEMINVIINRGILTIRDSAGNGVVMGGTDTGDVGGKAGPGRKGIALVNEIGATCTIESGTIRRGDNDTFGNYTVQNKGKMYIKGGLITNNSNKSNLLVNYNSQGGNNYGAVEGVYMEISGGTVSQRSMSAIKNDPGSTMKITGTASVIERTMGQPNTYFASNLYGTVVIDGGTLTTDGLLGFFSWKNANGQEFPGSFTVTGDAKLVCNEIRVVNQITGGKTDQPPVLTISGDADVKANKIRQLLSNQETTDDISNVDISGGTFSIDVGKYCVEGKVCVKKEEKLFKVEPLGETNAVAKVSDRNGAESYYKTLPAAVDAAVDGETVTLLKDIPDSGRVTVKKSVVLDLNGKSIGGGDEHATIMVNSKTAEVEIKNGSLSDTMAARGTVYVQQGAVTLTGVTVNASVRGVGIGPGNSGYYGKATLNSGTTITAKESGVGIFGPNDGTSPKSELVVNEGVSITSQLYGIAGNGINDDTLITINGGAIEAVGGYAASPDYSAGIYHPQQGTLTITGGTISGKVGVQMAGGTAVISGGELKSTDTDSVEAPFKAAGQGDGMVLDGAALSLVSRKVYGDIHVTVTGGDFISGAPNKAVMKYGMQKTATAWEVIPEPTNSTLAISAGTYSSDVSDYCVEGYKAQLNETTGKYHVVKRVYVAQVGEEKFETLQAAVDAAAEGDIVTLLQDVEITQGILISRKSNVTLDGGNHKIAVKDNAEVHAVQVWRSSGVNIKDLTITGAGKDALLVNQDSTVTAANLNTSGSGWGAVNVDKNSAFTLVSGSLAEDNKIWADDEASTVTVPEGWSWVRIGAQRFYTTGLSISLNRATAGLYSNTTPRTVTLTVTGAPEGAAVVWSSSDETVATVDENGLVTAVENGTAVVTVTVGSMTASCAVTVTRYTSGGGSSGGSGSGSGSGTTTPPVEEELGENDTPLTDKPLLFEDVAEPDWFYEAVYYVFDRGMMKGVEETRFAPQMTTTRAMIVTILHRLEKEPEADASTFSDVGRSTWYTAAVDWVAANGIVKGFEDNSFRPEEFITREQMAAILGRYATFKGYDKTLAGDMRYYNDKTLIADWAKEEMTWAVGAKILRGKGNNLLDPQGSASRAEAAEMLKNFCQAFAQEAKTEK